MGIWSGRTWWSQLGLGKHAADDSDDFGDMGTAFGLDASMAGEADLPIASGRPESETPASPCDRQHRRSRY